MLVLLGILIGYNLFGKILFGCVLGLFFFITQQLRARREIEYYISFIEVNENQINIEYFHLGNLKVLKGRIEDLEVCKKMELTTIRSPYLYIKFNSIKIRQYVLKDWKEIDMDVFLSKI